ncbi:MAG: secretin and TonB N-terminal domain-containing protein [Candidatus Brocadiales bacterium]
MKKVIVAIIIVSITGCAGLLKKQPLAQEPPPASQIVSQKVETPRMEELPVSQVVHKPKEKERLYALSVQDMDVRSVLFIFSKELPEYNVIIGPDVTGAVTVDFKNLPLDKALTFILEPLNLEYFIEGNILQVSRPKLVTRSFEFVYSPSVRMAKSILMAVTGGGGGGGSEDGGSPVSTSFGSVETNDTINIWKELERGIRDLLSEDGKLSVNARVGYISVTDYRSNLKTVEEFIEFFKNGTKKQILIRAKILEVTLAKGFEFGINWSLVLNNINIKQPFAPLLGQATSPIGQSRPSVSSDLFQFGITRGDFDAVLRALETQGKVKVLSAPEVATLNGQTAIIRSVREDAVFQTTVTNTAAGSSEATTVEPFTFGVYLDVIPHVDSEGIITMFIHPSVSSLVTTKEFKGAQMPIIDTRETDTVVTVMDGETVIIAGLMKEDVQTDTSQIPLLGDIPVVGKLFRREIERRSKSELVILISPTVVGPMAKNYGNARKKYRMIREQFPN